MLLLLVVVVMVAARMFLGTLSNEAARLVIEHGRSPIGSQQRRRLPKATPKSKQLTQLPHRQVNVGACSVLLCRYQSLLPSSFGENLAGDEMLCGAWGGKGQGGMHERYLALSS